MTSHASLSGRAQVLAAAAEHPFARGNLPVGAVAVHGSRVARALVWDQCRDSGVTHLAGLGDAGALADLMDRHAAALPADPVTTLPRAAAARLVRHRFTASTDWDLRWTHASPVVDSVEVRCAWLDAEDDDEVAAVIDAANPRSTVRPGDPHVRRWAGARDRDGDLVTVGADTTVAPGVGHLSGIATRAPARGSGFGAALTAFLTASLLTEATAADPRGCDVVTLGIYADNPRASALYARLGFTHAIAFTSGVLIRC